jgi:hypothetical protein
VTTSSDHVTTAVIAKHSHVINATHHSYRHATADQSDMTTTTYSCALAAFSPAIATGHVAAI